MTEKKTIRSKDLKKINNGWSKVTIFFKDNFFSLPFCNRCKKEINVNDKEIHHVEYSSGRRIELLCRECHNYVTMTSLPSFDRIKDEKAIFITINEGISPFDISTVGKPWTISSS